MRTRASTSSPKSKKHAKRRTWNVSALLTWAFLCILLIACVKLAYAYGFLVWLQTRVTSNVDSDIYWAVGRGIVNGLTPYADLFETKPPAIFLLTALSYFAGGTRTLGIALHTIAVGSLAFPLAVFAWKRTQPLETFHKYVLRLSSVAFGLLLAIYAMDRTGEELQVESFGAAFGTLYALVLVAPPARKWLRVALASLCMFGALGFKEPFLFTCLASALLLCGTRSSFWRGFLLPLQITAVAGVAALAAFGMLVPYLSVYLPYMLGHHVEAYGSPFTRGLMLDVTFKDIESSLPFLSVVLIALAGGLLFLKFLGRSRKHLVVFDCGTFAFASYLTLFAVGLGGQFFWHHFVFAVPFYAAAFLEFTRLASEQRNASLRAAVSTFVAVILCFCAFSAPKPTSEGYLHSPSFLADNKRLAYQIDGIIDACGFPTYLFLGRNGVQPYGLTRHPPLGPLFFQLTEFFEKNRPMQQMFRSQLRSAEFIVFNENRTGVMHAETRRYLERYFTDAVPSCARRYGSPARWDFRFLFRKTDGEGE